MSLTEKSELRARLLDARRARSDAELTAARVAIRSWLVERVAAEGWRRVAAYEPLRTEPGSDELLSSLVAAGVHVIVPLLLPDRDLDWTLAGASSGLGLDAIADCDAVLVPALAVSRDGVRLGRGGGSYDRALARCRTETPVIALLFDDEVLDFLPSDPWDVPVREVVTPAGFVRLG